MFQKLKGVYLELLARSKESFKQYVTLIGRGGGMGQCHQMTQGRGKCHILFEWPLMHISKKAVYFII
jgi:hypothetical protein